MIISDKWIKKALKHQGIKSEHAYIEAIKEICEEIDLEINRLKKLANETGSLRYKNAAKNLEDFKLNNLNTNKK